MKKAFTHNLNDPDLHKNIAIKLGKFAHDKAKKSAQKVVQMIENESSGKVKPRIDDDKDKYSVKIIIDKPEEIKIYREKGLDKAAQDMMLRLMKS